MCAAAYTFDSLRCVFCVLILACHVCCCLYIRLFATGVFVFWFWPVTCAAANTFDYSQLGFCALILGLTRAQLEVRLLHSDSGLSHVQLLIHLTLRDWDFCVLILACHVCSCLYIQLFAMCFLCSDFGPHVCTAGGRTFAFGFWPVACTFDFSRCVLCVLILACHMCRCLYIWLFVTGVFVFWFWPVMCAAANTFDYLRLGFCALILGLTRAQLEVGLLHSDSGLPHV